MDGEAPVRKDEEVNDYGCPFCGKPYQVSPHAISLLDFCVCRSVSDAHELVLKLQFEIAELKAENSALKESKLQRAEHFKGKLDDRYTTLILDLYAEQARLRNERDQWRAIIYGNSTEFIYEYRKDWHKEAVASSEKRISQLEAENAELKAKLAKVEGSEFDESLAFGKANDIVFSAAPEANMAGLVRDGMRWQFERMKK